MKTPGLFLAGLGIYLPEVMTAREAVENGLYREDYYLARGWTGATVARDMPAPDMAILAGKQALERSGHGPGDIGVHIHACGHEQGPSGWSAQHYVLRHVADTDVTSYRIWQSCNGMMGAMELAACFLLAVRGRSAALLTGSDNLGTPEVDRWDPGVDNAIFGDSGCAVVLSRRSGFARLLSISSASLADAEELYRGNAPLFPPRANAGTSYKARQWLGGDEASGESLTEVVARQAEIRTEVALRALAEADTDVRDVARVAHVFVGHERHLRPILGPMGIATDRGLLDYGRGLGHLTVSDQVAGLDHLVVTGQVVPGDRVLLVGHGGGVAVSAAVVRVEKTPDWGSLSRLPITWPHVPRRNVRPRD